MRIFNSMKPHYETCYSKNKACRFNCLLLLVFAAYEASEQTGNDS
jgi:hypothetical protein